MPKSFPLSFQEKDYVLIAQKPGLGSGWRINGKHVFHLNDRLYSSQFSSVAQSCLTLWDPMHCSMSGFSVHQQLLELTQTHAYWVHDAIQPSHPLSYLLLLPSCFPSIRVFSKESIICIRWPKHWSFSFRISPSNEYSGLIAFRLTGLIPAVQGILKSLLQHHGSKAAVLSASTYSLQLL